MKHYGARERICGFTAFIRQAFAYLIRPREVEIAMLRALELRREARRMFHGETR